MGIWLVGRQVELTEGNTRVGGQRRLFFSFFTSTIPMQSFCDPLVVVVREGEERRERSGKDRARNGIGKEGEAGNYSCLLGLA